MHPFFSSWKSTRTSQEILEITEVESKWCSVPQEGDIFSCPIHVYETLQDDLVSLDWKDWLFYETTILNSSGHCGSVNASSSVFDNSVEPLKFDSLVDFSNYHGALFPHKEVCLDQSPDQGGLMSVMSRTISSISADGEEEHEKVHEKTKLGLFFVDSGFVGNQGDELQASFVHERMMSYNPQYENQPNYSLWTNKYEPKKALEVCGNGESVRFVSEWLQRWHERASQPYKNSAIGGKSVIQDKDYSIYDDDSDTENMDEGSSLKNVLLITGPVGSGKSAAIYACAKEQGFQVIEVSASDWRNGAHVKQKFGEAMESHGFNKWSLEDPVGSWKKCTQESPTAQDFDNEAIRLSSITCNQEPSNTKEQFGTTVENETICSRGANKTLVLFEDVDTIFDEDRGFIGSILQIAETAKRPIILTSNSKDPALPQLLDRLAVDFTLPSPEELLSNVYMVCGAEKANISPELIARFIGCCEGDIRKTIMFLQFWCQGKRGQGWKMQHLYSPLQFDLDAGHRIIPKIVPWGFPSHLSNIIAEEISKTLSVAEENVSFVGEEEEGLKSERTPNGNLDMGNYEMDSIKARKEAMLSRNGSVHDCTDFSAQVNDADDIANASGSPVTFARRTVRRKLSTVLSSDSSDDNFCTGDLPAMTNILFQNPNDELLPIMSGGCVQAPSNAQMCHSKIDKSEQNLFRGSDGACDPHIYDKYRSIDTSFVPESSFVPETEIGGVGFLSRTISCGHYTGNLDDVSLSSVNSIQSLTMVGFNSPAKIVESNKHAEAMLGNICELDTESVHGNEDLGHLQNEDEGAVTKRYPVMDECSRANFKDGFIPLGNSRCPPAVNFMQETWRELRNHHEDLKSYVNSEHIDISQIVKLTSGLTNLISEADVLLSCCQPVISDSLEPSMVPYVEPDATCWYDEQLEMTSTFAQHGLCFYTKKTATMGLNLGCENKVDLAQEMLACSTNTTALGKLVAQEMSMGKNSCRSEIEPHRTTISLRREIKPKLYDAVLSIVPARLHITLKGDAFHEYLSFISQISNSEASRLLGRIDSPKMKRRARASPHYLSTGPLALSSKDVQLLAQHGHFREVIPDPN
ncbi:P-loop containing nucleoside triphosphate hydrolases superfamily protein isoform X2 [Tasmannia lanceolata]